jgi:hypothetical protein
MPLSQFALPSPRPLPAVFPHAILRMVGEGFEPSKAYSRQIYSLLPLATWVPHRVAPLTPARLSRAAFDASELTARIELATA